MMYFGQLQKQPQRVSHKLKVTLTHLKAKSYAIPAVTAMMGDFYHASDSQQNLWWACLGKVKPHRPMATQPLLL